MTIGALLFPSLGAFNPPTTSWTYEAGASGITAYALGTSQTVTMKPNTGDLMIISGIAVNTSTPPTSITVSDTGSGGWTVAVGLQRNLTTAHALQMWWKVATSADFNGGSGITITITQSGGTGTQRTGCLGDDYRLSSGSVTGADLSAAFIGSSSVTTVSFSPGAGSGQSGNTDELAYIVGLIPGSSTGTPSGTNTFTGTSAAVNLSATHSSANQFFGEGAGLCQASATAGSNVFVGSWAGAVTPTFMGATFYHS